MGLVCEYLEGRNCVLLASVYLPPGLLSGLCTVDREMLIPLNYIYLLARTLLP